MALAQRTPSVLAWSAFMKRVGRAHLLMGTFDADETLKQQRRRQSVLLKGLARALCRQGRYAVTILHDLEGEDLAMIAVEHRLDANRISRTLGGRAAASFGPWLSHRSFTIDASTYRRIALALSGA
jgi:hypothetical protein